MYMYTYICVRGITTTGVQTGVNSAEKRLRPVFAHLFRCRVLAFTPTQSCKLTPLPRIQSKLPSESLLH